jgi:hypothetical protein
MSVTLDKLRAEHGRDFIGPDLKRLLERVASATARTYPPFYSDAGVWNADSIADALQGWTAERLIERRDLTKLLAGASSEGSLRAGLTRSFEQYLTNKRERSSVTNLYARTVKLLRSDADFQAIGRAPKPHQQLWTLAGSAHDGPARRDLRARLKVAAELSDEQLEVVKYGPMSLKSSPILRAAPLKTFVTHLLHGAGALTPPDIIEVMRRRFALVEPESVEISAELEVLDVATHDQVAEREIARSIAARLGKDRARSLKALAEAENFATAAEAIGEDEAAIRRAYTEMLAMVAEDAVDPGEAAHVCGLILETLFGGNE